MKIQKRFRAKEGASFGNDKAQVYGNELERIRKENAGILTPQIVVEEAKEKSSPIHNFFEWNNDLASEKYRLSQARQLINHINVIINHKGTKKEQRAYLNVTKAIEENDEDIQRIYVTIERALSEPKLRKQTLNNAIREIEYWKEKYKDYKELSVIFCAIRKVKNRLFSKGRAW